MRETCQFPVGFLFGSVPFGRFPVRRKKETYTNAGYWLSNRTEKLQTKAFLLMMLIFALGDDYKFEWFFDKKASDGFH